ncbi:MAG: WecB/TagA/CpsF family glycosyltransferase [Vampirovibrionales bacterium]|nr:WecB/TagA/CpsF family glycosyltransferase [Vampirovibrionales bacterium]
MLARSRLFDFQVDIADRLSDYVQALLERLTSDAQKASKHPLTVVTINPEMIMAAERQPWLKTFLCEASLVLPDGAGVVWALRRAGVWVNRMPGIEFSALLLAEAARQQLSVALIGASAEVNQKAVQALTARYSGLRVVYAHSGFFTDATDEEAVANACANHHPQLVFVALGVPRQEAWMHRYARLFNPQTAFIGVGGSFDVWAGVVRRAPQLMCALNLEWLWRLLSQPFRIRRAGPPLAAFVWRVLTKSS